MACIQDFLMSLVIAVIFIWDVITLPIYFLIYRPWKRTSKFKAVRSKLISSGKGERTYRGVERTSDAKDEILNHTTEVHTMDRAFDFAFQKFGKRRCLGTRKIISEVMEKTSDGKEVPKLNLGSYSWQTYEQVADRSLSFGKGLRALGLQQREKLVIYADTRADWLMAAIGCFKVNVPIVTIYTNLGDTGVQYGINQTQAEYVLVSQELLPKLINILTDLPNVKTLIVFEDKHKGDVPEIPDGLDVRMRMFEEVIELGKSSSVPVTPPFPEDTAIIMYTSGSTGNPKGVVLTHFNLINAMLSLLVVAAQAVGEVKEDDIHIAYLPLAHVLELLAENAYIILGVGIGYSSPYTLIDTSAKIKKGQKGDATVLQPTLMCAVPVILDRIYKGINKKLDEGGEFKSKLVHFLIDYRAKWVSRGYDTPIAKALVFKKMRAIVGGRLRMLLSGGAPLTGEVQIFIRTCLCVQLHQGYGLTETAAVACVTDENDISTECVGPPLYNVDIKLVDWDEGNYQVDDSVGPRGEIIVGGHHIAKGYYNMPEQTALDFYDEHGKRWFRTGDIGHLMPDGTFKIVDRKKDLVKLQTGEYVSLGKVESILKLSNIVETVCVCVRSTESTVVSLVVPDQLSLIEVAKKLNKQSMSRAQLCEDPEVKREYVKIIAEYGSSHKLERFEIPKGITLIDQPWTPETGMVTAALKLKRPSIEAFYKPDIDRMYVEVNEEYNKKTKPAASSNKVAPV